MINIKVSKKTPSDRDMQFEVCDRQWNDATFMSWSQNLKFYYTWHAWIPDFFRMGSKYKYDSGTVENCSELSGGVTLGEKWLTVWQEHWTCYNIENGGLGQFYLYIKLIEKCI